MRNVKKLQSVTAGQTVPVGSETQTESDAVSGSCLGPPQTHVLLTPSLFHRLTLLCKKCRSCLYVTGLSAC